MDIPAPAPLPSVEEMVSLLNELTPREREIIRVYAYSRWGENSKAADGLGLVLSSYGTRVKKICSKLHVSQVVPTERKCILTQAFAIRERRDEAKLVPMPAVLPEEEPEEPEPTPPSQPQWGPAVQIELPEGVVAIDVVSGAFNGVSPSKEMESKIALLRQEGFKPHAVALYPSNEDPTVTLGQVVMVKRNAGK